MNIEKIDSLKLANSIPSENDKTNMIAKLVCETADLQKENQRLNNIINELEKKLLELRLTDVDGKTIVYRLLDKLQELKGVDKE